MKIKYTATIFREVSEDDLRDVLLEVAASEEFPILDFISMGYSGEDGFSMPVVTMEITREGKAEEEGG